MLYITLFNILSFFLLFLFYEGKEMSLLITGLILASINIIVYIILYYFNFGDIYLFLTVSMLVSIGLVMQYRIDITNANRQLLWFMIGIAAYLLTMILFGKLHFWNKLRFLYMAVVFVLLILTAIFGKEINGSKNWIIIKGISIQPSEIIKLFFCLTIACFYSKLPSGAKKDKRKRIMGIPSDEIYLCVFVYICMGALCLVQREWGTALLLFLVYFSMCSIYKTNHLLKLINIGGIIFAALIGYFFLAGHIGVRVEIWKNPWQDPLGKGYQIVQSLIAIVSGGYFGLGLGLGSPHLIPFRESDFIFAAICEEMGIFTGIAVILLYFLLTYRGVKTAMKCENEFLKAACMALVLCFGFQTFIIVGGVIKLIPLTGITLPFVSYGGSSMISSFIILGVITAFSFAEKKK
jgi:cell division protein FtsW (lipid II flippase)